MTTVSATQLADEFRSLLKAQMKLNPSLNPNSNTDSTTMTDSGCSNFEIYEEDGYVNRNTLSKESVNDLKSIVTRMHASGHVQECLQVYVNERKHVLGVGLECLNVEKLSVGSCRRLGWGVLDSKIKVWIKAVKICFRYYFVNEKRLCEEIFGDLGDERSDSCFMDVVTDCVVRLFDNAEAFSCVRPASERLFKMLDVYETLYDLVPVIDSLFRSQSSDFVRDKVVNQIMPKVAVKANEILLMFESSLVDEESPVVEAEPVHRLSKYVMHYVYKLCDREKTLMRLCLPSPPSMDTAGVASSFSDHLIWIITSLVSNLETKAKLCKDSPASRFFAMNNFHYIIQKIQARQELLAILAGDSFDKLVKKFEHVRSDYLKLTFDVVLRNLRDEKLNKIKILSFRVSKMTDRLKRFNVEFEKLQKDLGKVVVPDFGLVLELRKLIVEMVVTAYSSFLVHTKTVGCLEKYVKYSVEEIESVIQDFFDCNHIDR